MLIGISSHTHIQFIQERTKGKVLMASHKKPSINELSFYDGQAKAYFVNAVWPDDILDKEKRLKEFTLNPGFRMDLTLDFEKKMKVAVWDDKEKKDVTKWVKNPDCSKEEKLVLVDVLQKIPYVAWAGLTPSGVHGGIYFPDWQAVGLAATVLRKLKRDLADNGYSGPLELDWSPSVNCNRPSRFLDTFEFWRPERQFDVGSLVNAPLTAKPSPGKSSATVKVAATSEKISLSQPVDPVCSEALRLRAFYCPASAVAAKLGKTVEWVQKLWAEAPQEAYNPFCQPVTQVHTESGLKPFLLGKLIMQGGAIGTGWEPIGPRSSRGRFLQVWPSLYQQAAWSWEWCWQKKWSLNDAQEKVFTDSQFAVLLQAIRMVWEEANKLNKEPMRDGWENWTKKDIERCYEKFANGFVAPATVDEIRIAVDKLVKVTTSTISMKTGHAKSTICLALRKLGYEAVGKGRGSHFQKQSGVLDTTPSSEAQSPPTSPELPATDTEITATISPVDSPAKESTPAPTENNPESLHPTKAAELPIKVPKTKRPKKAVLPGPRLKHSQRIFIFPWRTLETMEYGEQEFYYLVLGRVRRIKGDRKYFPVEKAGGWLDVVIVESRRSKSAKSLNVVGLLEVVMAPGTQPEEMRLDRSILESSNGRWFLKVYFNLFKQDVPVWHRMNGVDVWQIGIREYEKSYPVHNEPGASPWVLCKWAECLCLTAEYVRQADPATSALALSFQQKLAAQRRAKIWFLRKKAA